MVLPVSMPQAFGRYQVLEELGAGAMGIVYLCVDSRLNRPVAIKVMRESEFMTPAEREQFEVRFRHEAEAAGRLNHPDIVQVYDVGPSWMVMEFLEGVPLSVVLKRGERLSVRRVAQLVLRVSDAVDYAHRHGIVHRDIKPANIMLTDEGGVKVMDFGVARLDQSTLTALGTVVGSVRYMAPEQMMGERVDGRADVFSVAAVAYELLTGRAPFPGKTITEVVSRVVHGAHVPPQQADVRLPEGLNAIFARAFAPRPADRYPRAADFARDLHEAAEPAFHLEVVPGSDAPVASRTEVPAPTATPALTVPAASAPAPLLMETVETAPVTSAPPKGLLLVELEPAGATVELDGARVEVSSSGLALAWGSHSLRLSHVGCEETSVHFEVTRAHPVVRVSATLPPHRAVDLPPGFVPLARDVVPPRRVAGVLPTVPVDVRSRGSATADVDVRETGEVLRVLRVEGDPRLLDALLEAIRGWRFAPATRKGAPVAVRLRVQHLFVP
jgi:predicted Ser/Thr protein kinase